ncbi:MAG TPA: TolC family protein, partial [Burkholderiaceae bacterium]|nr:TolC family protein [Burkholderiaceae bacterium]
MTRALMNFSRIAVVVAAMALTACATTDARLPALDLPAPTATHVAGVERWWTQFDDPQLTALIEEALAANLDLRLAIARIDEARANLRLARSALYPSLDADFGASRARRSNRTDFSFGPEITNSFTGGLQAAYEVDLWGRIASGRNAAQAQLLATRYSAETVRTALAAQVASTYFSLRAFDAELKITRDTLGTRAENVKLF